MVEGPAAAREPELLTFDPSMLTHDAADEVRAEDYPEVWRSGPDDGLAFPISYQFEPGAADDGLTIDVPVATLNQVTDDDFSWNVPGLREELVTALIRSLPKNLRVSFVPAPDKARDLPGRRSRPARSRCSTRSSAGPRSTTGVVVPRDAWDWSKVAEHLRPTYRVVDEQGAEQGRGKDLEALKEPLRPQFAEALAEVAADTGLTRHRRDDVDLRRDRRRRRPAPRRPRGRRSTPALLDEGTTVGLGVFGSVDEAQARHRLASPACVLLNVGSRRRARRRAHQRPEARPRRLAVRLGRRAPRGLPARRRARRVDARPTVRDQAAYDALLAEVADGSRSRSASLLADVLRALDGWRTRTGCSSGRADMAQLPALSDMKAQLARLVHPGFVGEAGAARLRRYPAYLAALGSRRSRLDDGLAAVNRDRQLMAQLTDLEESYLHAVAALPPGRPPGEGLRRVRWLLEEYRISLFAQEVGPPSRLRPTHPQGVGSRHLAWA